LTHHGALRSENRGANNTIAISPSGLYQAGKSNGRAATRNELHELRDAFVQAAMFVQSTGADGLELHGCHGFLLDQFLWADTNRRDDEYGGDDINARLRFPAEVVAAIRSAVDDKFVLSYRLLQWKEVDYTARIADTPEELGIILSTLRAAGVDIFHASARRFYTPEWPGSDLGFAGWTKSLTDAKVIAVGSVGLSVDVMESLLGEQEARFSGEHHLQELIRRFGNREFDLIGVGRSVIADADWVSKIRAGNYGDVIPFAKRMLGNALELEPTLIVEAQASSHRARNTGAAS